MSLAIVSRSEWGSKSVTSKRYDRRNYPIYMVYLSLKSGLPDCTTRDECVKVLEKAQNEAITIKKLSDIPFNFILSSDGTIYEGRGWENKPEKAIQMEKVDFDPRAYDIALFGDWSDENKILPDACFKALMDLLQSGIKNNYVYDRYDLEPIRVEKFEPDYYPGTEQFKDIKPIKVKEPIDGKPYKGPYREPGKSHSFKDVFKGPFTTSFKF